MIIGIISDTHDHIEPLRSILKRLKNDGVAMLIHAGDFVAPFSLRIIVESHIPLIGVFGNNDGEIHGLQSLAPGQLHKGPYETEIEGKKYLIIHDITRLTYELKTRVTEADVIIHGHTHKPDISYDNGKLIINPGESCGVLTGISTYALLDSQSMKAEIKINHRETV